MLIEAKNLKYIYSKNMPGETVALDDVSFKIDQGEIIGIIGHTGSGKSTLLQELNGLIKPDSGKIIIDGLDINSDKVKKVDVRKKVGLVFQYPEYQLFEENVEKDVAFGPKNLGKSTEEIKNIVKKSIELVGLDFEEIKGKSPFALSGGQKRRVAIAGVLAMEPKILILDEPTAGLDPAAHKEIIELVKRIHKERNSTIIFVSHNMDDISYLSDRIMVMDMGKLKMFGTPEEVFKNYDELKKIGLGVPGISEIMHSLKEKIPEINDTILNLDEATDEISSILKGDMHD